MESIIINLYGGPCSGKSTIAAGLYFELKCMGIDCELTGETAKDKVWDENPYVLKDQPFVIGDQIHRIWRLNGKVKFIICDSPILLGLVYMQEPVQSANSFQSYLVDQYKKFNNKNFFIKRNMYNNAFNQNGRVHNEDESIQKDKEILDVLKSHNIDYTYISVFDSKGAVKEILERIL